MEEAHLSNRDGGELCTYARCIMDTAHDFLLFLSADLRVVKASRSFYRGFALKREDVEGLILYDIANRLFDVPAVRELLEKAGKATDGERFEVEEGFPIGGGGCMRAAAGRVHNGAGKEPMIFLAIEDISVFVSTEDRLLRNPNGCEWTKDELRDRESLFRMLVETMNDGLAVRNENGVFTYINGRFSNMLGYAADEVVGRPVTDFLDEANQSIYREQIAGRERGEGSQYDLAWIRKDGIKVHTIMSAKPIFNSGRRGRGSFAVVTDISSRQAMEEALRESERKLRLVSSHLLEIREKEAERISRELHDELGQGLAVLKHQTRFIEGRLHKSQKALKEACADAIQHIDSIMESLRRIVRDLSPSILKSLGLTASLNRLAEDFARHSGTEVSVRLEFIDNLLPQGAEINLYRVFQEALTNVSKHAQATHVSIEVTRTTEGISVRIADNGKGFSMPAPTASDAGQSGLGLAIMEERARMLKGSLDIRSSSGTGTDISLFVPTRASICVERHT